MTVPNESLIVSVDYQLTQQDLVRALRYPTWGDPKARKQLLQWWLIGIGVALVLTAGLQALLGARSLPFVVVPFVLAVEWPLLLWSHPKSLAKIYAKQPAALEPARLTVRPEALLISTRKAETRMEWHAIRDIAVTGEYTLFILGRYQVVAVPWRCFESPSAAQRLSALAREYWLTAAASPRAPGVIPAEVAEVLGPERIVVQYDQKLADVCSLIIGQLRRKPRFLVLLGLVSVFVGAVIALLFGPAAGVVGALALVVLMLGIVIGMSLLNARLAKGVLGPHTLVVAPVGYWSEAPGIASSVQRWSTLSDIAATDRHILMYRGTDFVFGIPRRAFASAEAVDRFLAQVTRWRLAEMAPATAAEKP